MTKLVGSFADGCGMDLAEVMAGAAPSPLRVEFRFASWLPE